MHRWLRRLGVTGLLAAPVVVLALVAAPGPSKTPDIFEPTSLTVEIGPHTSTVNIRADIGAFCMDVSAPRRGGGTCASSFADLRIVTPFGDGEGDAEYAVLGVAPPEAVSVRVVPDEGEPFAGTLVPIDGHDEQLFVAYWSDPRPAPPPPHADVLDADDVVLLSV